MIRVAVSGACGRMGRAILAVASRDPALKIAGAVELAGNPNLGLDVGQLIGAGPLGIAVTSDPCEALEDADVLIDFTHPSATPGFLKAALREKTGYVVGTTGLDKKILRALRAASSRIPIVQSPNMSIGVNLLFRLSEFAGRALDENYDIEIVEYHHRMKKDAPSGTALKLLDILAKARGTAPGKVSVFGRQGETGVRPKGQIGVMAVRGGDVVGDHIVSFLAEGERIELIHRATSRDTLAKGALYAAKFVAKRKHGLYNMLQVLGIA